MTTKPTFDQVKAFALELFALAGRYVAETVASHIVDFDLEIIGAAEAVDMLRARLRQRLVA